MCWNLNFTSKRYLWLIALFSFLILFLVSPDSFIYDIYKRADDAMFFTAGRAWMNGLTPYVDFSDSKGPLLWLIYGLGYLMDHTSFSGVFFLSYLAVFVTYYYLFRVVYLYTSSENLSFLVMSLTTFALFNPQFHYFTRAETFCWPVICLCLYKILDLLRNSKGLYPTALICGFSFAWCFFIKFTIAAMILIFCIYVLIFAFQKGKLIQTALLLLLGVCIIAIPFTGYFISKGNLLAFLHEYFVATTQTVAGEGNGIVRIFENYSKDLLTLIGLAPKRIGGAHFNAFVVVLYSIGAFMFCLHYEKENRVLSYKFASFVIAVWITLIASFHAIFPYYYEACSPFAVFSVALIVLKLRSLPLWRNQVVRLFSSMLLLMCLLIISPLVRNFGENFFLGNRRVKSYFLYEYLTNQFDKPKFVSLYNDKGVGLMAEALPACKYWFIQNGATTEMYQNQIETIQKGIPDFVLVPNIYREGFDVYTSILQGIGYDTPDEFLIKNGYLSYEIEPDFMWKFYARPGLKIPDDIVEPSPIDLFFKRNIFK